MLWETLHLFNKYKQKKNSVTVIIEEPVVRSTYSFSQNDKNCLNYLNEQ